MFCASKNCVHVQGGETNDRRLKLRRNACNNECNGMSSSIDNDGMEQFLVMVVELFPAASLAYCSLLKYHRIQGRM